MDLDGKCMTLSSSCITGCVVHIHLIIKLLLCVQMLKLFLGGLLHVWTVQRRDSCADSRVKRQGNASDRDMLSLQKTEEMMAFI